MLSTPEDIFSSEISKKPWNHTIGHIDDDTRLELVKVFENVDWSLAEYDQDMDIEFYNIHTHGIKDECHFISKLLDSELHSKIFDYYNVDYTQGYEYTLVFDKCGNNGHNQEHNDVNRFADVITLQYYLMLDDESRRIKLNGNLSEVYQGNVLLFKSDVDTNHSFDSGYGKRYSLRLRLKTKLLDANYIHDRNDSSIGIIIDAKNMESNTDVKHLERRLARITFEQCRKVGFGNIVVFEKMKDMPTAINTLKQEGIEKCILLFAGAMPGSKTQELLKEFKGYIQGEVLHDLNRVARKYLFINLSKLDTELQYKGDYLSNVLNQVTDVSAIQADIGYLHPDDDSVEFLKNIVFFNTNVNANLVKDDIHANLILERLGNLCKK